MTIETTTDPEVIRELSGDLEYPDTDLWLGKDGLTVLVARENGKAKMMALVYDKGVLTKMPEVHLQAPGPYRNAVKACRGFKAWIMANKPWKTIWSYTVDPQTFAFAKHLGFQHAFDEDGKSFIVLSLMS